MNSKSFNLLLYILMASVLFSCVPSRQFEEIKDKNRKCEEELELLKSQNKELTEKNTEATAKADELQKKYNNLIADTTENGIQFRKLYKQYKQINDLNDELLKKQKELLTGNESETRKLLAQLQDAKLDLQKKEDALKELELALNAKKKDLEAYQAELDAMKKDLEDAKKDVEAKNSRLVELESILARKDSAVKALKDKVTAALLGFEGDGLSIVQKNGKVYVSLDEKLLFKSGKWDVDPKGQNAIKKLAEVLEKNEDINVMIEGHTDDVPYGGSGGIADNWDLSVKRATSIVKIITANSKINPTRLIASGRGEFLPVETDKTPDARQKNRRTEIILTPKLDELFKMLESN